MITDIVICAAIGYLFVGLIVSERVYRRRYKAPLSTIPWQAIAMWPWLVRLWRDRRRDHTRRGDRS